MNDSRYAFATYAQNPPDSPGRNNNEHFTPSKNHYTYKLVDRLIYLLNCVTEEYYKAKIILEAIENNKDDQESFKEIKELLLETKDSKYSHIKLCKKIINAMFDIVHPKVDDLSRDNLYEFERSIRKMVKPGDMLSDEKYKVAFGKVFYCDNEFEKISFERVFVHYNHKRISIALGRVQKFITKFYQLEGIVNNNYSSESDRSIMIDIAGHMQAIQYLKREYINKNFDEVSDEFADRLVYLCYDLLKNDSLVDDMIQFYTMVRENERKKAKDKTEELWKKFEPSTNDKIDSEIDYKNQILEMIDLFIQYGVESKDLAEYAKNRHYKMDSAFKEKILELKDIISKLDSNLISEYDFYKCEHLLYSIKMNQFGFGDLDKEELLNEIDDYKNELVDLEKHY